MKKILLVASMLLAFAGAFATSRTETLLKDWNFSQDSIEWKSVQVPHDWAIYGPFDRKHDLQKVAVKQNGETEETWKTGRTGGLPYAGKGFYNTTFDIAETDGRSYTLVFDGAMSNAHVYVNGKLATTWPYGYSSFYVDVTSMLHTGENTLAVSLENKPMSSRWYPGAGIYRNVHLLSTDKVHIPVWGTQLTTPYVSKEYATVHIATTLEGVKKGENVTLTTQVTGPDGKTVATDTHSYKFYPGVTLPQNLRINNPELWSPETPSLYTAITKVVKDGVTTDEYTTCFGIRSIEARAGEGFFLNGEKIQFKGVCNHHDLGPLGAAVNKSALRHQLELIKDMGANAVRTAHNMPDPQLVELCDEMGLMMMIEPFDDWGFRPKSKNGYGVIFNEWAERDVQNMVRQYRNCPSVVMWSIGNEVPSQWGPDGLKELTFLQDVVHREDPTRPVTCGMDQVDAVTKNGFAAALDIPGFNYRVHKYKDAIGKLPQNFLLGSETSSTVSSRGKYYFPVKKAHGVVREDNQCSSYDVEHCSWSNIPDDDFAAADDFPWDMGQFVWTGFDYLGEPSPYDTDEWPSHSSYFGIFDLASLPKDRFWLYRSKWNEKEHTLHILPHWNWKGREGEVTPVFVYTDSPKAELFINGKSQGVREKNDSSNMNRYRLMWNETRYEPGEVKAVAYNADGSIAGEAVVRTAGKPYRLVLSANRQTLSANGDDLAYITVRVADKDGNIVPDAEPTVKFKVTGNGSFRATANGDPTSLRDFNKPKMDLFSGAATVIVKSGENAGFVTLEAKASGLKAAKISIPIE